MESACWWWPYRDFVMVCERPSEIHLEQIGPPGWGSHRLHSDSGPAISWEGFELYYLHGVHISTRIGDAPIPKVIANPESLTAVEVLAERNVEVRRVMLDRMGRDRFILDGNAKTIDQDKDESGHERRLLRIDIPGDEPVVMVEVINGTPEPNGSFRSFLQLVPASNEVAYSDRCWREPWAKQGVQLAKPRKWPVWNCKAAVAWTYGLLPDEYQVAQRT